jgi:hypothetical protein
LLESSLTMLDRPTLRLLLVALPGLAGCNTISGADGIDLPGGGQGGAAPPPAMAVVDGVSIDQIAIYQGVKLPLMQGGAPVPATLPVVEGRDALLRVFYTAQPAYNGQPVTARLTLGEQPPVDLPVTLGGTSTDQGLPSTINFELPGTALTAPLDYRVELLQPPEQASGSNAAAAYPAAGARDPLPIQSSGAQVRIVLVPIAWGADGSNRLPDTSDEQLQLYQEWFYGIYPTATIELTVGPEMAWSQSVDFMGNGWEDLLNAFTDFRGQQHPDADEYYFGLFSPASSFGAFCGGGCVAGLSWQLDHPPGDPAHRAGIGLGFTGDDSPQTAVHEVGHLHGLPHAPGKPECQADGPDPNYPYDHGVIGVWGYSTPRQQLFAPDATFDMMSYCSPIWISDYNYVKLFERVRLVNGVAAKVLPPEDAVPGTYERITVGLDGLARWLDPLELDVPPGGEPVTAHVHLGAQVVAVQGWWHRYSGLPGGELLFPEPPTVPTKVELSVDGHWYGASRDQLTHLRLTNRSAL